MPLIQSGSVIGPTTILCCCFHAHSDIILIVMPLLYFFQVHLFIVYLFLILAHTPLLLVCVDLHDAFAKFASHHHFVGANEINNEINVMRDEKLCDEDGSFQHIPAIISSLYNNLREFSL